MKGDTTSTHSYNELTSKGDSHNIPAGSLVGHVDDDEALGVVLEDIRFVWAKVLWTITPDLTVAGQITNSFKRALANELGNRYDKQRILWIIDHVMHNIKQRLPLDEWKVVFLPSMNNQQQINVTFREYGQASFKVLTITIDPTMCMSSH